MSLSFFFFGPLDADPAGGRPAVADTADEDEDDEIVRISSSPSAACCPASAPSWCGGVGSGAFRFFPFFC